MNLEQTKQEFINLYGVGEVQIFYAPGRVNLIGEHTDYNGGYVFPCALSFGTYLAVRKRTDDILRFATTNVELKAELTLDSVEYDKSHDWANYPKGVIKEFLNRDVKLCGMDILFSGNIPSASGLSSSASVELATATMLNELFDCNIDMITLVRMSQHSENKFIGVNCGIMDQFAVGMGKEKQAMFLNCRTMEYLYIPLYIPGSKIVISNTNHRRGLADSEYNERRSQCEASVEILKSKAGLDIEFLGQLDIDTFEKHKDCITEKILLDRASHVVYENDRVLKSIDALKNKDLYTFGKLLNQSHDSLRDLYEVTGFQLDTLVEEAIKIDGVWGSRMTGAGFGGCTVSIVKDEAIDRFIKEVGENYFEKTNLKADFYVAEAGNGAMRVL